MTLTQQRFSEDCAGSLAQILIVNICNHPQGFICLFWQTDLNSFHFKRHYESLINQFFKDSSAMRAFGLCLRCEHSNVFFTAGNLIGFAASFPGYGRFQRPAALRKSFGQMPELESGRVPFPVNTAKIFDVLEARADVDVADSVRSNVAMPSHAVAFTPASAFTPVAGCLPNRPPFIKRKVPRYPAMSRVLTLMPEKLLFHSLVNRKADVNRFLFKAHGFASVRTTQKMNKMVFNRRSCNLRGPISSHDNEGAAVNGGERRTVSGADFGRNRIINHCGFIRPAGALPHFTYSTARKPRRSLMGVFMPSCSEPDESHAVPHATGSRRSHAAITLNVLGPVLLRSFGPDRLHER